MNVYGSQKAGSHDLFCTLAELERVSYDLNVGYKYADILCEL